MIPIIPDDIQRDIDTVVAYERGRAPTDMPPASWCLIGADGYVGRIPHNERNRIYRFLKAHKERVGECWGVRLTVAGCRWVYGTVVYQD